MGRRSRAFRNPDRIWLGAEQSNEVVRRMASAQRGVLARRDLVRAGVPRWFVRNELAAGRWQRAGRQVLVAHRGPLDDETKRWIAVIEAGPRAALDGGSALLEAGLKKIDVFGVHVIVPHGVKQRVGRRAGRRRVATSAGVYVHESRRFREEDVLPGPRRMRPAVATVHAALWARSEREATLYVVATVQQRLVTVEKLAEEVARVRRHHRRRLLLRLLDDLAGGVQSLGELDVAEDFRRRGFPVPERQQVRTRPSGRHYLDVALPAYRLVFEIDGAGHDDPQQRVDDVLRDLAVRSDGDTVVRLPLVAYYLDRERILDSIGELLRSRGWRARAA